MPGRRDPPPLRRAPGERRRLAGTVGYALAVLAALLALAVTAILERPLGGAYFFPALGSVVVVALHLGLGPALAAILVSVPGFVVLFMEAHGELAVRAPGGVYRILGSAATALLVAWFAARSRRASEAEREAARRLEEAAASERRARERYERLQAATVACSAARTVGEVASALVEGALARLDPSTVTLATVEGQDGLRLAFARGLAEADVVGARPVPLDAPLPSAECARAHAPVLAVGGAEIDRRWPALAAVRARQGFEALASVPIEVGGELQGVLGLTFAAPRALDPEEERLLVALADQAGLALARARSYEAERRARAEAEQVGRVKEQLLAVVGHDLRTPLSAIVNGANAMFRRAALGPQDAEALRRIASSAERIAAVIRDLLDFSRIRQGLPLPVQPARVHLDEVAREVLVEFEERPRPCAVELRAEGDLCLDADPQRLAQVLANLVGNAIQHGDGTPVRVELRGEPDLIVLHVHNAGPPIDPAALPELFEPFRRGKGTAPDGGSVGLGLYIVDAIVRAHGGAVRVESAEREGTTFSVTLPRRLGG